MFIFSNFNRISLCYLYISSFDYPIRKFLSVRNILVFWYRKFRVHIIICCLSGYTVKAFKCKGICVRYPFRIKNFVVCNIYCFAFFNLFSFVGKPTTKGITFFCSVVREIVINFAMLYIYFIIMPVKCDCICICSPLSIESNVSRNRS